MDVLLAFVVGGLYAAALYLMMRRSISKLILGLVLLGHAANLLILTVAGLTRAGVPVIAEGERAVIRPYADPIPQSLILTAIVIGFGVLAFAVVLIHRTHQMAGTDDLNDLRSTDR